MVARQSDEPRGQGSWGWALWRSGAGRSGRLFESVGGGHAVGEVLGGGAISLVPQQGVDGATDGRRGRCFGVEATSDTGPGDAGGDFGLVLVAAGRHDRHPVAQGVLDPAVAAVGDVDIGAWQDSS